MELLIKLDSEVLAILAGIIISVTKGITDTLKVRGAKKRLVAILVTLYYYVTYMLVITYGAYVPMLVKEIILNINTFLTLLFTCLGIYSFFPVQFKKDVYRTKKDMSDDELEKDTNESMDILVERRILKEH